METFLRIRQRHVTHRFSEKFLGANRKAADRTVEIVSALPTVKSFGQQEKEKQSFAKKENEVSGVR